MARHTALALIAALAAASFTLPAFAQPEVSPVSVMPKAPTSVSIALRGKSQAAVRGEIRTAARTVCSNAVTNHELSFVDEAWCKDKTQDKALRRFAKIVRQGLFADSGVILLAAVD